MKHLAAMNGVRADWLRPAALLLVGMLLLLQASTTRALTWTIQVVDPDEVAWQTSLALDSNGNPHISYIHRVNFDLRYAYWNNSGWHTTTVDESTDPANEYLRYTSLALDSNDTPHISYYDDGKGDLRYAVWNAAENKWDIEIVDEDGIVGLYNSLALDPATGQPRISYQDATNRDLKYAVKDGANWETEIVDGADDHDAGTYTSLALDANGHPRISYRAETNGDLMYAAWDEDTDTWDLETVDDSAVSVGVYTSLALDNGGNPRIAYLDVTNKNLKYAAKDGSVWSKEVVDSFGLYQWELSLALDPTTGRPRISYSFADNDHQYQKFAAWTGSSWAIETVDNVDYPGRGSSLALDAAGNPHISYYNIQSDLKLAEGTLPPAQLTITKSVAGSDAPTIWGFIFGGDLGAFSLDDGSPSKVFSSVTPGTKAVTETNPNGYATTVACDDGTTSTTGELSITLAGGDDVTCTFTNTYCQPGSFDTDTTWACNEAEPGHYVEFYGATEQAPCSDGYYQPDYGQTACLQADPGYYATGPAATQQTECAPGTYQPLGGASACIEADPGYYATGPAATGQTACPAGTTSPPGSDSLDDCVSLAPDIYLSAKTAGTTGDGLDFGPEDILKWDGSVWSTWFDGSDALLLPGNKKAKHNINAFWIPAPDGDDDVVMSFAQNRRFVPDITVPVDGTDLVGWDGVEFSFYFDGSDVGLDKKGPEKIDALHSLDGDASPINGGNCLDYLLISTRGPGKVPTHNGGQLKFGGEDVLGFCLTQFGLDTEGYWHLVVDGSAVGLPKNSLDSISLDDDDRTLYLTTNKPVVIDGVGGGHSMIYAYDRIDGTFSGPHFSAAASGLPKQVTGLQVDGSMP